MESLSSPLGPESSMGRKSNGLIFLSVINLLSESLSLSFSIFYLVKPPGDPFNGLVLEMSPPSSAKSESKLAVFCLANFKVIGPLEPTVVPYFINGFGLESPFF